MPHSRGLTIYHWQQIMQAADECEILRRLIARVDAGHQGREDAVVATLLDLSLERRSLVAQRTQFVRDQLTEDRIAKLMPSPVLTTTPV